MVEEKISEVEVGESLKEEDATTLINGETIISTISIHLIKEKVNIVLDLH